VEPDEEAEAYARQLQDWEAAKARAAADRAAAKAEAAATRRLEDDDDEGEEAGTPDAAATAGADEDEADDEDTTLPRPTRPAGPPAPQRRRLFMNYAWLLLSTPTDTAASQRAEVLLDRMLVQANVAPTGPFPLSLALRTIGTIHLFLTWLTCVPRSCLTPWTQPTAVPEADVAQFEAEDPADAADAPDDVDDDDDDERIEVPEAYAAELPQLLHDALLLVRRWAAKERRGKPCPKRPFVEALQRLLAAPVDPDAEPTHSAVISGAPAAPPQLETGESDVELLKAPLHVPRPYSPQHLRVFVSDIVLALVGRHNFGVTAATWLAAAKLALPRERWTPDAAPYVLAHSLTRFPESVSSALVAETLRPEWFAPFGRVDATLWLTEVASDVVGASQPLATHAFGPAHAAAFARRMASTWLERLDPTVGEALTRQWCPALAAELDAIARTSAEMEKAIQAPAPADGTLAAQLDSFLTTAGPTLLCTPRMMRVAVDAGNTAAALWLLRHGVAMVRHRHDAVGVLQFCTEARAARMLDALVAHHANLAAPWAGGHETAMTALQDAALPAETVQELEALWKRKEAQRAADPESHFGIRLGSQA
jgi:hypothetical protein